MCRLSGVLTVAIAFSICATPAPGQEIPKAVLDAAKSGVSADKMRMLTAPTGDLHCKGPGAGSLPYIKCSDVPIVVLSNATSAGECVVVVPYKTLVVHTKKSTTQVTWNLIGADGYVFDATAGIAIPTATGTYTNKGSSKQDTQFTWEIAKDATQVTHNHVANVKNPSGVYCDPGDPAITNDPS